MICTAEALDDLLQKNLSPKRRAHSCRVGELAAQLSRARGWDTEKAKLAGLAHDLAREMPEEQIIRLAVRDGRGVSFLEDRYPVLLHGRAAAAVLREQLGVDEQDILEAVAWHVTGRPGMGQLARVVFAADFLEPGRDFLVEEQRTEILSLDLQAMLLRVLEEVFNYLRFKGKPVAPPALDLHYELIQELART